MYCIGCGYDLRGLTSERCPECGLAFDAAHRGTIPWERRKALGYFRSFFGTLVIAIFKPTRLARATAAPIDLRSARLFRWIVRVLIILPVVSLFAYLVSQNGGMDKLVTVSGPLQGATESFWEPRLLWTVGATFWPALPVGFVLSVTLATGISHWFAVKRLDPVRQNRAMIFSIYLCPIVGWIWLPLAACAAVLILDNSEWVDWTDAIAGVAQFSAILAVLSTLVLLVAMLNSLRAARAATQCGVFRLLVIGTGIAVQAAACCAIGLGLFPVIVGLFRLMIASLLR